MPSESSTSFSQDSRGPAIRSDGAFDVLSSRRRRTLIQILQEMEDEQVECSTLATELVDREGRDYAVERDTVLIDLHHRQLPKLAEADVVEYDPPSGAVRYRANEKLESLARAWAEMS